MNRPLGPPRGVLRVPSAEGVFYHARIAAPASLADIVQHFWIVRWEVGAEQPQRRETLPHPNVHLVFEGHVGRVYGILDGRFTRTLNGQGSVFGVKFRAGGFRPLLDRSVAVLRNRCVGFEEILGAAWRSLPREIVELPDDEARVAAVSRWLAERIEGYPSTVPLVGSMVETIEADRSITTVDAMCERWSLSKRSLQRMFHEYVGVGPKWVINRYRLHEALERLHAGDRLDWAELALELGYFDQSHFNRDFRGLVGHTPAGYVRMLREQRPLERL